MKSKAFHDSGKPLPLKYTLFPALAHIVPFACTKFIKSAGGEASSNVVSSILLTSISLMLSTNDNAVGANSPIRLNVGLLPPVLYSLLYATSWSPTITSVPVAVSSICLSVTENVATGDGADSIPSVSTTVYTYEYSPVKFPAVYVCPNP